jgi:hypothetical protein
MVEFFVGGEGDEAFAFFIAEVRGGLPAVIEDEELRGDSGGLKGLEALANFVMGDVLVKGVPGAPAEVIQEGREILFFARVDIEVVGEDLSGSVCKFSEICAEGDEKAGILGIEYKR